MWRSRSGLPNEQSEQSSKHLRIKLNHKPLFLYAAFRSVSKMQAYQLLTGYVKASRSNFDGIRSTGQNYKQPAKMGILIFIGPLEACAWKIH